jgi:hypothetical protein
MEAFMKANLFIKSLLIALALSFGTQTARASILETYVKPLLDNKIATLMTISTTILGYICYCLIKKLNRENLKNQKLETELVNLHESQEIKELLATREKLDEATTLLDEIYRNYQQMMMRPNTEESDEIFLNEQSSIDGLTHKKVMDTYLSHQRVSRISEN